MPAISDTPHCTLHILQDATDSLHRYQLALECKETGGHIRYELQVTRKGKSGTSQAGQSGTTMIDSDHLLLGNVKINLQAADTVLVTGMVRDADEQIIAEAFQEFSVQ
ncbi:hypothetical protein Y5S_00445 [Alcanivorax nanhaiticus]|uniref:Curli assembly protein CsgC n=2 Tax=Alcanivorax nanhaiticus TaxID=1177154 RepID=A0A095TU87_9GAMM|nr:hypothetical protein Y5S_00445 [Alcanivorax nanhaiticus]